MKPHRVWPILAVGMLGATLALVYVLVAHPMYESRVSLVPVTRAAPTSLGSADTILDAITERSSTGATAARIAGILRSQSVIDPIIATHHLMDVYRVADLEHARTTLLSRCPIEVDKNADLVTVTCGAEAPQLARDLTDDFARLGNAVFHRLATDAAAEEHEFLVRRIAEAASAMQVASDALTRFEQEHRIADAGVQAKDVVVRIAAVQSARMTAALTLAYRRGFASDTEASVQQLRERIRTLDAQLAALIGVPGPSGSAFPPALALPAIGAQLQRLYVDQQLAERTYLALIEERSRSAADLATAESAYEVLDAPDLPEMRVSPRAAIVPAGFALGAVLGLLALVLRRWWRALATTLASTPAMVDRRGYYDVAVLLAFFSTVPLSVKLGLTITVAEVVAFPAALCLAIEAARSARIRAQWYTLYQRGRWVFWYVAWCAGAAVVGLARSTDGLKAFRDLIPGITLFALLGLTVHNVQRLRGIAHALVAGVALHLVLAVPQALVGGPYLVATHAGFEDKLDLAGEAVANSPVGLFVHPNGLGLFLAPFTLFALALVVSRPARGKLVMLLVLALDATVLALAHVKGVYAFLAIVSVLLVVPARSSRLRAWLGLVLPVVGIIGITWYALSRFLDGDTALGTVVTRLELWDRATELISSDSVTRLVGNGYPRFDTTDLAFVYPNAHNAWLNEVLSFGIPGLLLYLGCFVTSIRRAAAAAARASTSLRWIFVGATASLALLLGECFFEPCDRGDVFPAQLFLLFAIARFIPEPSSGR